MKSKKTFKQFVKENAMTIGVIAVSVGFCAGTGIWPLHVKRHTTDFEKPVIDGATVHQYYTQFGEKVLNATTTLENAPKLLTKLAELFPSDSDMYIMTACGSRKK